MSITVISALSDMRGEVMHQRGIPLQKYSIIIIEKAESFVLMQIALVIQLKHDKQN